MDRRHTYALHLLVALLSAPLAACGAPSSVITDLSTELPAGDRAADRRLRRLEVELWFPSPEPCRALIGWRRAVCGRECSPPPSPRDSGRDPDAFATLDRRADGTWSPVQLRVAGDGPWEAVVRGLDATGTAFLYGCVTVASGDPATVTLFRPWCDTAACAGQFHPACPVEIDCITSPADGPDRLGPPRCRSLTPVVYTWEQGGVPCDPMIGVHSAPCLPARVVCEPGHTQPDVDGVCPAAATSMCGASLTDDLDCDGRFAGPCGRCAVGATTACGAGACAATSTCDAMGHWGACVVPTGGAERCDGVDQDCDGRMDEDDPDAFAACNAGRPADAPLSDRCDAAAGGCRCGADPACAEVGAACCAGACIDIASSPDHCGGCGRVCQTGTVCWDGVCTVRLDGGACTVARCNVGRPPGAPRADRCFATVGECGCGASGDACVDSDVCCHGTCISGPCAPSDAGAG